MKLIYLILFVVAAGGLTSLRAIGGRKKCGHESYESQEFHEEMRFEG